MIDKSHSNEYMFVHDGEEYGEEFGEESGEEPGEEPGEESGWSGRGSDPRTNVRTGRAGRPGAGRLRLCRTASGRRQGVSS